MKKSVSLKKKTRKSTECGNNMLNGQLSDLKPFQDEKIISTFHPKKGIHSVCVGSHEVLGPSSCFIAYVIAIIRCTVQGSINYLCAYNLSTHYFGVPIRS